MRVACIVMPHLQANDLHDRKVLNQLVDALSTVTGRVEAAPPGVRLDGLEQLHDGETQQLKALLGALPKGLDARLGVAGGKFPA